MQNDLDTLLDMVNIPPLPFNFSPRLTPRLLPRPRYARVSKRDPALSSYSAKALRERGLASQGFGAASRFGRGGTFKIKNTECIKTIKRELLDRYK